MPGLKRLLDQLNYNKETGLHTKDDILSKNHLFPFRISHVLNFVLEPTAVLSPYQNGPRESFNPINNPLILIYDNPSKEKRKELVSQCFSFSQAPVVLITDQDGNPEIYHGYDFEGNGRDHLKKIEADIDLFRSERLASGETWRHLYHQYYKNVKKVDKWLLSNVVDARRLLVSTDVGNLPHTVANRLIGRLLFIRYLIDRNVQFSDQNLVTGTNKKERAQSLNRLLMHKGRLYRFFHYITSKFQGDLFPIKPRDHDPTNEIELVTKVHLNILHHLFSCSQFFVGENIGGYYVQPSLFDVYDFEVIPVELISNIYENFLGDTDNKENERKSLSLFKKSRQSEIKAYYTPPYMVDYVLSQTVDKKLNNQNTTSAKILDPSCGSGIFLVETIRKLVQHHLKNSDTAISNEELWDIVRNNIYGIDIDSEAIEISIFSIYITLLDYKTPIEIEHFKFRPLKGINLFSGSKNDFFNTNADFQPLLSNVDLDFIIGNPPWGKVKESTYMNYVKNLDRAVFPEIGNHEISQAFLIRVNDFMHAGTECMFIVTGKVLYNTGISKSWRQWFLDFYELIQVAELSPVNNKVTGGPEVFEGAKQSPAILHFKKTTSNDHRNLVKHITFRPNINFLYFKAITVTKRDIKFINQNRFIEKYGGNDWLWKILVHGSFFDVAFINRLKTSYTTLGKVLNEYGFTYNGGLKYKDGDRRLDVAAIMNMPFLELEERKEFKQFRTCPTLSLGEQINNLISKGKLQDDKMGYLPDLKFFKSFKVLCKKGLEVGNDFKGVAAVSKNDICFPSSVMSIVPINNQISHKQRTILWNIAGLINSTLFSYFVFNTSSSAGIDRTRIYFEEFLNFPIVLDERIAIQSQKIQEYIDLDHLFDVEYEKQLKEEFNILNSLIYDAYKLDSIERSLIDYTMNVSIPSFKRIEDPVYRMGGNQKFKLLSLQLTMYSEIFADHFRKLGSLNLNITISIGRNFSVSLFQITKENNNSIQVLPYGEQSNFLQDVGQLTLNRISQGIYLDSDLKGFGRDYFYIIKPSEFKFWHEAIAHEDLSEIMKTINESAS
ncbi:hypothetical protein C900_03969 [Fulvivirga imtechensis AK7]|uniref:site-specific DNA-methyltransferase (adenine-specific) n=1 Tax=Fulvivirga imtechensis AK7 TaxID=1237149 RepID=L8JS36_9BACT|nr:DNA methyltransferase [Fulvivirga imtechensis]ELR70284.1 hypothetical protein C900_03969 [Fulvivirga imtechensis AK7]